MPRTSTEIAPSITVRDETGELVETSLRDVSSEAICRAQPYRTFRWYLGQKHYSGSYWSSTESAHVIYESRLELARLLMADFDRTCPDIDRRVTPSAGVESWPPPVAATGHATELVRIRVRTPRTSGLVGS